MQNQKFIHFTQPLFGNEEKLEVIEALDSGWVTLGPRTKQFESEFAAYVGAKHAVAVSSNTAGMHLSLLAAGIGPGDEVITTAFTFVATTNVIIQVGATPVLVDIDKQTYNIDTQKIAEKITTKTKAIMPVHYAGLPVNIEAIKQLAQKHNLIIIEDCAHAAGGSYKGQKLGTHGDLCIFSFHPVKNMSTGDGGMVTTNNPDYAAKIAMLRLHGMSKDAWKRHSAAGSWQYDIETPGFKYNMTDVAAALGIHQLRKLDSFIAKRRAYAKIYDEAFAQTHEITTPFIPMDVEPIYSVYTIRINTDNLIVNRDEIVELLKSANIGASIYYIPVHYFTYYKNTFGYQKGDFPITEGVFEQIISLPLYPKMSVEEVNYVAETLNKIIAQSKCQYTWQRDNFDTEIFGINTAKIKEIASSEDAERLNKTVQAIQKDLLKNEIEYAVFRAPSQDFALVHALESNGFVMVDGLVAMTIATSTNKFSSDPHIRDAEAKDLPALRALASTAFELNRVFNDPLLDKSKAGELYANWIENSVNGQAADRVLVWSDAQEILGFITLQKNGHIPLIAVKKAARGKGLAQKMVNAALALITSWGVEKAEIETQVANIPALNAYQACGFKITAAYTTFRWAPK